MRREGFTLVEMLLALAIFGLLAAAGVTLLSLSVRAQQAADRGLDEIAGLRRAGALLSADLAQAAPRPPRAAFQGGDGSDPLLLALVRRGWANPAGAPRSSLQRVEYRLGEGRLERTGFGRIDGDEEGQAALLAADVRGARLRYRDRRGDWSARWDHPTELPRAVELIVEVEGRGALRQLFLVGPES